MIWIVIGILIIAALIVGFYPMIAKKLGHDDTQDPIDSHADDHREEPSLIASLPKNKHAAPDLEDAIDFDQLARSSESDAEQRLSDLIRQQAMRAARDAKTTSVSLEEQDQETWKAMVQASYHKRLQGSPLITPTLRDQAPNSAINSLDPLAPSTQSAPKEPDHPRSWTSDTQDPSDHDRVSARWEAPSVSLSTHLSTPEHVNPLTPSQMNAQDTDTPQLHLTSHEVPTEARSLVDRHSHPATPSQGLNPQALNPSQAPNSSDSKPISTADLLTYAAPEATQKSQPTQQDLDSIDIDIPGKTILSNIEHEKPSLNDLEPVDIQTHHPGLQDAQKNAYTKKRGSEPGMTWAKVTHPQEADHAILSIYIMAARSKTYTGDLLAGALKQLGCQFNESLGVFEFKTPTESSALFYVTSAMKPGTFDLNTLETMTTQGLGFFLDTTRLQSPKKAFLKMLEIAHLISEQLRADILDSRRERLTESGVAEYLATLKAIEVTRQHG